MTARILAAIAAAAALLAPLARAQSRPTSVSCGIFNLDGSPMNGTITIANPSFLSMGAVVQAGSQAIAVAGGQCFPSIALVPTDTAAAIPGSGITPEYTVFTYSEGATTTTTWLVPTSSAPVTIASIESGGGGGGLTLARFASPPTAILDQAFLFTDASASGTCAGGGSAFAICAWNGSAFVATGGAATGLGDPGANGIVYRSGSGTSSDATATQMSGPNFCSDAGSTGAYACNLSPAVSSYVSGTLYWFKANTANTGASSINFNSKGTLTIKTMNGSVTTDTVTGDIRAGQWVAVLYDGTNAQMVSQRGSGSAAATLYTMALTVPTASTAVVGANCGSGAAICAVTTGNGTAHYFSSPLTVTVANSHTGTGYVSIDSGGTVQVAVGGASLVTGDISGSGFTVSSGTGFAGTCPAALGTFVVTSGVVSAGTDNPALVTAGPTCATAGTNVSVTQASTGPVINVATGAVGTLGALSPDGSSCTAAAGVLTCSGGSAPYTYMRGVQSPVTQTGSATAAFTVASVPALPAGACYDIEAEVGNNTTADNLAWSLYVDTTQIVQYASTTGTTLMYGKLLYCNTTAQSAQAVFWRNYGGGSAIGYAASGVNIPTNGLGNYAAAVTPTAINWATSHTIYIYTTMPSPDTVTPYLIHIVQQ